MSHFVWFSMRSISLSDSYGIFSNRGGFCLILCIYWPQIKVILLLGHNHKAHRVLSCKQCDKNPWQCSRDMKDSLQIHNTQLCRFTAPPGEFPAEMENTQWQCCHSCFLTSSISAPVLSVSHKQLSSNSKVKVFDSYIHPTGFVLQITLVIANNHNQINHIYIIWSTWGWRWNLYDDLKLHFI